MLKCNLFQQKLVHMFQTIFSLLSHFFTCLMCALYSFLRSGSFGSSEFSPPHLISVCAFCKMAKYREL